MHTHTLGKTKSFLSMEGINGIVHTDIKIYVSSVDQKRRRFEKFLSLFLSIQLMSGVTKTVWLNHILQNFSFCVPQKKESNNKGMSKKKWHFFPLNKQLEKSHKHSHTQKNPINSLTQQLTHFVTWAHSHYGSRRNRVQGSVCWKQDRTPPLSIVATMAGWENWLK